MTDNSVNMAGKVVLITGGTGGIGRVTAEKLAGMGAEVVIIARNREKAQRVVNEIKQGTGNQNVDFLIADLSSQAQVRQVADEFRHRYNRLDVLINNAGGFFMKRELSVDGIPYTWALNHYAYFLLTNLLLDMLEASAPSRIINVSSAAHLGASIDMQALRNDHTRGGYVAYGDTKLANVLFTYELARRLQGTGVTVNALHPGFVATNFAKNNGALYNLAMVLLRPFAISPEKGAETSVYLASSPEVEGVTEKYFVKQEPVQSSKASYDQGAARQLWEISEEKTGLKQPVTS